MTTDLADWLLEQINEDERLALAAAGWRPDGTTRAGGRWTREGVNSVVDEASHSVVWGDGPAPDDAQAAHIVAFAPARVLAESEAKRRLLVLHRLEWSADDEPLAFCAHDQRTAGLYPCSTLLLLALPYADREGYREEWRP